MEISDRFGIAFETNNICKALATGKYMGFIPQIKELINACEGIDDTKKLNHEKTRACAEALKVKEWGYGGWEEEITAEERVNKAVSFYSRLNNGETSDEVIGGLRDFFDYLANRFSSLLEHNSC